MSDRINIELERARVAIEHGQREACDSQIDAAGGEDNASCVGPPPSLDDALDAVAKLRNALASEGGGTDTPPNAQSVGDQLQPESGENWPPITIERHKKTRVLSKLSVNRKHYPDSEYRRYIPAPEGSDRG